MHIKIGMESSEIKKLIASKCTLEASDVSKSSNKVTESLQYTHRSSLVGDITKQSALAANISEKSIQDSERSTRLARFLAIPEKQQH